jgi:metal-sulfur cluster biosynthetic enzyme
VPDAAGRSAPARAKDKTSIETGNGSGGPGGAPQSTRPTLLARLAPVPTRDDVLEALREVEDPELGMDIVELGLLYDVEVEGPRVKVTHSLTSMGCPAGPMIQEDIQRVASEIPGVEAVDIELTWDPPWTPERMSDDAKFILGFG